MATFKVHLLGASYMLHPDLGCKMLLCTHRQCFPVRDSGWGILTPHPLSLLVNSVAVQGSTHTEASFIHKFLLIKKKLQVPSATTVHTLLYFEWAVSMLFSMLVVYSVFLQLCDWKVVWGCGQKARGRLQEHSAGSSKKIKNKSTSFLPAKMFLFKFFSKVNLAFNAGSHRQMFKKCSHYLNRDCQCELHIYLSEWSLARKKQICKWESS